MQKSGIRTVVLDNARPFGFGSAFRKDRWFATVPNYQHPGTSGLAPQPGTRLEKTAQRTNTRANNSQDALLKPTRTWPQTSTWLSTSICGGRENCQYEPRETPIKRLLKSGCDQIWQKHSTEVFQAFLNANPDVMFRDNYLGCVNEIEPYHRCNTRDHRALRGWPIAHAQICRLPDGRRFIISQPYCGDQLCRKCLHNIAWWQTQIPHLRWVTAGRERSWYFPNNANLLLLGPQETLDSLRLDYPVPTESRPEGCVRYQTHL